MNSRMKIKIYHISIGLESKFNLFSKPFYYKSKFENWRVLKIFGVYLWIYPREHNLKFSRALSNCISKGAFCD